MPKKCGMCALSVFVGVSFTEALRSVLGHSHVTQEKIRTKLFFSFFFWGQGVSASQRER